MDNKTWQDFFDEGLGPSLPLSAEQQQQLVSGVLPSGESNMFDFAQQNTAINKKFPDPANDEDRYDVVFTSGEQIEEVSDTGIFHFQGVRGEFSSPSQVPSGLGDRLQAFYRPPQDCSTTPRQDYTFRVQDSYIHHKTYGGSPFEICFLSSYNQAIQMDRYGNLNSYYNAGY